MQVPTTEMAKAFFSWRQPGGALSVAAHLTLLIASVYAFSSSKPFEPATEAVAVDVVSESQFNEMVKGRSDAKKQPEPKPVADRVAEVKEDRDPGLAKKNVPTPPPPPQRAEVKPEPIKPEPPKPEPVKVEPPKPEPQIAALIPPVRPPLRTAPPIPAPPEPDEEVEEAIRQKPVPQKVEPKPEPPKPEALRPDALDKLLKEQQADELKKAEDLKKAADLKKAQDLKKAEAERKAREEKAKKDREAKEAADAQKLNDAIRAKLLTSKETPASTGSTAAAVNRQASLGTQNATGQKLSPSDKAQLIGILTEQMSRCVSYTGSAPRTGPQITFTLGRDGAITSQVQLVNRSAEPSFVPFAEASMRALRNCQPYRIPARFLASYDDWKNVRLNMITDALQ